jgi:alkanesulfonate monooxygenase SsuD/methylene tetrahydromethanopterin reductase-like flavin-dependent oxidoreductase (luciferase family)
MRSVGRIFVSARDHAVAAQTALARAAESVGLEGIWIHGPTTAHGDSYATTAAAAIASVTTDLRLGVMLTLAVKTDTLRLAEDIAVLDHCSSGRAELWLDDAAGAGRTGQLIANLRVCSVDGREIAVTPGPLQPTVPVAGSRFLRVGAQETQVALASTQSPDTLRATVEKLRGAIDDAGAQDVVFVLAGDAEVAIVATVLAPLLRANEDEVADLVLDTLKFQRAARSVSV